MERERTKHDPANNASEDRHNLMVLMITFIRQQTVPTGRKK
jgi:hypothetical protein